ncbi:dihydrofolate reductase family protein [Sphingoaurantiacus capsulatus]|uniref:Dihydrofolate reductase family protein n=1 Tax=Sphingoaurantiacus capsulatus TaxID=1771310 RepID=A0ABV7X4Q3_9SPHN
MRKVVVGAFVSLDGVMQGPGGPDEDRSKGFDLGGWLVPHFDESVGRSMDGLFDRAFDLLLGRKTYEIFAAHWPHVGEGDPVGDLFDRITKYVATRDAGFALDWRNSESLAPDAVAAVKKLKAGDGPDLLTQGSTELLHALFAADLVDEMFLLTFPVVLGEGKKLFGDGAAPRTFTLDSSKVSDSGVVISRYLRAGAVTSGSFALDEPTPAEVERRAGIDS